jgi:hypothetical protein
MQAIQQVNLLGQFYNREKTQPKAFSSVEANYILMECPGNVSFQIVEVIS